MGADAIDTATGTDGPDSEGWTGSLARAKEWLLIDGDRLGIAVGIAAAILLVLLWLNRIGFIAFIDGSITRMASGMIAGTFSLVTIVVSINQLILSRELSTAGEYRDRLEGVDSFRRDVEERLDAPASPAEPRALFGLLAAEIRDRARSLEDSIDDRDDEPNRRAGEYARYVAGRAAAVDRTVSAAKAGTFSAVSAAIDYDDGWQIHAARYLRNRHAETLSDGALEALSGLLDALELFGVAREHFRTTYMQRELTHFSQLTVICGIPAALAAVLVVPLYAGVGGAPLPADILPYVTIALTTVVMFPLALLAAFILRTATVARRTSSVGPMFPRTDPEIDLTGSSTNES